MKLTQYLFPLIDSMRIKYGLEYEFKTNYCEQKFKNKFNHLRHKLLILFTIISPSIGFACFKYSTYCTFMPICGTFSVGVPYMLTLWLSTILLVIFFLKKSLFTKNKDNMERITKDISRLQQMVLYFKVAAYCGLIIQASYFLCHLLLDTDIATMDHDFYSNLYWTIKGAILLVIVDKVVALIEATIYNKIESSLS